MKKIIAIIPIAIIIILLSCKMNVYAAVITKRMNEFNNIVIFYSEGKYRINCSDDTISVYVDNGNYYISFNNYDSKQFNTLELAHNYLTYNNQVSTTDRIFRYPLDGYLEVVKGFVTGTLPPYIIDPNAPTPTPVPSWYSEMWDTLSEELGNPAFWFGQWFIDLIDNVFGNDENEPTGGPSPPSNSTHVQINNPTITPAPTPLPYTTIIIPKTDPVTGDVYYEENYYYLNPSGTPIVSTQAPSQYPSQDSTNTGNNYNPTDPYEIPFYKWLTNGTISSGSGEYNGLDSIGSGIDSIDSIGSEYNDGMSAVQDATGTLPISWLLLIGIAAAIPLLAGIISRFLGG